MKLGVTGSRLCFDYELVKEDILYEFNTEDIDVIVSGGANGVDSLCERFAKEFDIPVKSHKPNYERHGKGAPLVRNREIVDECDVLMAWPLEDPKSYGTISTIEYARKIGKKVIVNPVKPSGGTE